MNKSDRCALCSDLGSEDLVPMWDSRTYCRRCIEKISPELYEFALTGAALEETLERNDFHARHFLIFVGPWCLAAVAIVFGLPLGLLYLAGKADIWGLVFVLGFFGGVRIAFLALQSTVGALLVRSGLPRTVSIENGQVTIRSAKGMNEVPLAERKWYMGSTAADQPCMFTGLRRGVVIQTPDLQIAVGRSPATLEHWRAFLTLARVPQNPPHGCLRIIVIAVVGIAAGVVVGAGIGRLVSIATKNESWTAALGLMGFIEGGAIAVLYTTCTSEGAEAARKRLYPALLGLAFFAIGMKIGAIGGWSSALICGSFNATLGVAVGFLCRAKLHAAEMDREFGRQCRS